MQDMDVALSGAMAMERRMSIIANNMANVSTPGYCADHVTIAGVPYGSGYAGSMRITSPIGDVEAPTARFHDVFLARLGEDVVDFTPGPARQTGQQNDVMIDGDGFLVVETPWGNRYTRQGNLSVAPDNTLRTVDGFPVLGENGRPVELRSPSFTIKPDATMLDADGEQFDALRVVQFDDKRALRKEGNGLFIAANGAAPKDADMNVVTLRQGYLEESNVRIIDELVNMINTERAYQSYQKVIRTADDLDSQLIAASTSN